MGLSKKDLGRHKSNLKRRVEDLEAKARLDPAKKNKMLHDELALLKKKLAESE